MAAAANLLLPNEWRVERSIAAIEAEWRELEHEKTATPFQSYEWMSSLLAGPDSDPNAVFVLGYRDGQLRALFPLSVSGGALRWLHERWGNYNMPLVSSDLFAALNAADVDAMWRSVRTAIGNPKASILRHQPLEINGGLNPFARWANVPEPTKTYSRTLGSDWPSFYDQLHALTTRKTLERKQRKLEREGNFACRRVEDPSQLYEQIMLMLAWKSDQLDANGRRNPFSRIEDRERFARFGSEHPHKVRLYTADYAGAPVAINLLLEAGDHLIIYQMAYDAAADASRQSPGRLLLNHIMQEAIAAKHRLLDFSVGDDPYKSELCDVIGDVANSVKAHSLAGMPIAFRERSWILFKTVVKSNPALLEFALKANGRLKSFRQSRPSA